MRKKAYRRKKPPKRQRRKRKMKLRTLLPLILLTLLLTQQGFTQAPPALPESSGNAYGIAPEKSYPGTLVLELLETAETEIDAAVNEAYAEGYKAAMLRYAPEAELYKTLAAGIQADLAAERKRGRFLWPAVGISFAAGLLGSLLITGR
jgi:hypothetical protein